MSPIVAWLAHEDCPASGEIYSAAAGRISRYFIGLTEGYYNPNLSLEDVRDHFAEIARGAGLHRARTTWATSSPSSPATCPRLNWMVSLYGPTRGSFWRTDQVWPSPTITQTSSARQRMGSCAPSSSATGLSSTPSVAWPTVRWGTTSSNSSS